jgi:plastocyanin
MKLWRCLLIAFSLAATSPAAAKVIQVEVNNLAFSPAKTSAHAGDTIEWINKDFVVHSATAKDKQWDIALPTHGKGKALLKKAGHIDYYCKYHPTMEGAIEVSP